MRGPFFNLLIKNRELTFFRIRDFVDLETQYTIMLECRNKTESTLTEFDERIALAALCHVDWPGKLDIYSRAVHEHLKRYRGITFDPDLQEKFRNSVSARFRNASTDKDIDFNRLSETFDV